MVTFTILCKLKQSVETSKMMLPALSKSLDYCKTVRFGIVYATEGEFVRTQRPALHTVLCSVHVCASCFLESDAFLLFILRMVHRCLQSYELVYRQTYLHSNAMATLLEMGAQR